MYFRNTGNTTYGLASNWSTTDGGGADGAIPTAADDANFTANSGPCVVSSSRTCKNLITTGYTQALVLNSTLSINGTAVTLGAACSVSGTSGLLFSVGGITLTTNGVAIQCRVTLFGSNGFTTTLSGNATVNSISWSLNKILNGNTLFVVSAIDSSVGGNLSGTTTVEGMGAFTWSGSASGLTNNFNINAGSNTFTVSGTVSYRAGTLTYISGTPNVTGSTLSITAATTLSTGGMTWDTVLFNTNTATITLNGASAFLANTMTITTASFTQSFAGAVGFNVGTLNINTPGCTVRLGTSLTYNVSSAYNVTGTSASRITLTAVTSANFVLASIAAQSVVECNATNINSSGGQTIFTSNDATLVNTVNWNKRTPGFFAFF